MNIKVKTALIIIITLVMGIIIGAMLNRALLQRRINRAFSWRLPDFMIASIERIVEPDQEQRKRLREVLKKHAERMREIRETSRKDMQEAYESLRKDIEPILTPEQKRRLQRRLPGPLRRFRRFPERPPFKPPPDKKPPEEPR